MKGHTILLAAIAAAATALTGSSAAATPTFSFQTLQLTLPSGFDTPEGIATGDFDGQDGPDLVFSGFSGNLAVYLNDGHGGFGSPYVIDGHCPSGAVGVAAGHFSASGHEDLLVACNDAIHDGFVRYQGNGDGTFQIPTTPDLVDRAAPIQAYAGENDQRQNVFVGTNIQKMVHGPFGGGQSIVWNEFVPGGGGGYYLLCTLPDSDFATQFGATECSITVDSSQTVQGYLVFPPPLVLGTFAGASPSDWAFTRAPQDLGLSTGSLVGAVHDPSPPPPEDAGFGSANFEPMHDVTPSPSPLVAGDLNGDGTSEVIGGNAGDAGDHLAVYQLAGGTDNGGTIIISDPVLFPTNPTLEGQYGAAVADFSGDGNPDVAVLGENNATSNTYLELLAGDGQGSLGAPQSFQVANYTSDSQLASADLNGDGYTDLVAQVGPDVTVFYDSPATHFLTVQRAGSGAGSISSNPTGIDCGATCSKSFDTGTQVTLTATPAAGSRFAGWSGAGCSGTATCVVTLSANQTVTATFVALHTVTVQLAGSGSGSVTSSPTGIDCGATCSARYDTGTQVTLTATPASGSVFSGWSGGGCSGTGTCVVTLAGDETVTAPFALLPPGTKLVKSTINAKKHKASFKFEAIGTATGFECSLEKKGVAANFKACSSPKHYASLHKGHYTFEARAVNGGLADPTPAKKRFKIKS